MHQAFLNSAKLRSLEAQPTGPVRCDRVSFCLNVGQENFRNSTLLRKINASDFAGAAAQFLVWVYAGGVVQEGLEQRRKAEADMFIGC